MGIGIFDKKSNALLSKKYVQKGVKLYPEIRLRMYRCDDKTMSGARCPRHK
jgi:hypothetical protein